MSNEIFRVGKIGAAVDQLDWAIKLFLDEKAYVPAITLAGAADGILGEMVSSESAFRKLKEVLSAEYGIPGPVLSQQYLNKAKNWLKHWQEMKDEEYIELELETEAIQYIVRAVTNLITHDRSLTSETLRFFTWLGENRKDLRPLDLTQHVGASREPDPDTLRAQLVELNNRGRQYGGQIWQVPFAYVGIVGVVLTQVAEKASQTIYVASLCGALFGVLVFFHLTSMANGSKRAVLNLLDVEAKLGLTPTAQYRPFWYIGPLVGVVLLAVSVCIALMLRFRFSSP